LTPEERALLFRYCWDQAVAECEHCAKSYRITELASDLFIGKELFMPPVPAGPDRQADESGIVGPVPLAGAFSTR
jgi:hypothetical protein